VALRQWSGEPAPVGSIVVADVRPGIAALAQALRAQRTVPWCPVCLVIDGSIPAKELCCFEPWPDSFAFALSAGAPFWPAPESIVRAIRARSRPEASHLAGYVAHRTRVPKLETLLKSYLFAPGAGPQRSPRTVARHCTELGTLLPHEWSRLSQLVGWILESWECGGSFEHKAAHAGIDQRTMRRWLNRLLGISLAEATEIPGWEWILESALRRSGYIEGIPATTRPLRSRQAG
jgi:hypothetical protein